MPDDPTRPRTPPALAVSVGFGSFGLVALILGLIIDVEVVALIGVAAAAISLIAALVWREELISAWHAKRAPEGEDPSPSS